MGFIDACTNKSVSAIVGPIIKSAILKIKFKTTYINSTHVTFYAANAKPVKWFLEEKIKVGDWNINYLKVGNGAHNVLCIPGALGSVWTDFRPQVEGFDREKFTLVVMDPPGYGKSWPPERDFPPDFFEKDADYAYEFMKELNIPNYSTLGWSDGGKASMILAEKYPKAVNKLVIWATNSFILPHELEAYKLLGDVTCWSEKMKKPLIDIYGEEVLTKYAARWLIGQKTVFNARNGDICADLIKTIKCPTLILYGQKDPIVDSSNITYLHKHIKGSRLHLYPEGKHNLHLAYSEDFNKRVQQFLLESSSNV